MASAAILGVKASFFGDGSSGRLPGFSNPVEVAAVEFFIDLKQHQ